MLEAGACSEFHRADKEGLAIARKPKTPRVRTKSMTGRRSHKKSFSTQSALLELYRPLQLKQAVASPRTH